MDIRAGIVTLALAISIFLLTNGEPPRPPSKLVQTDYCWIDYLAAAQKEDGTWVKFWTQGYGPCSQQDIYRDI